MSELTYTEKNGILYPNVIVPEEEKKPIGKYGRMRLECLKNHRPVIYNIALYRKLQSVGVSLCAG